MYITSPGKFPARALYTPPSRECGMEACIEPSPGKFPARALYTPPFRTRGMSGNRPFNRRCLSLLRQRVSTLSLYTPFFPLSNSVDIIFTEILFSKSPLSQYKVFKVQTGELSEFLLGRSSPISEEKLCFQTLVFNLLT